MHILAKLVFAHLHNVWQVHVYVFTCLCVCVCVCVWKRDREICTKSSMSMVYSIICYIQGIATNKYITKEVSDITYYSSINISGLTIVAQWKLIWLASVWMQVQSLPLLSGLEILCCHELWCRSQLWLGSRVPVSIV